MVCQRLHFSRFRLGSHLQAHGRQINIDELYPKCASIGKNFFSVIKLPKLPSGAVPLKTVPYVPSPIFSNFSYRPTFARSILFFYFLFRFYFFRFRFSFEHSHSLGHFFSFSETKNHFLGRKGKRKFFLFRCRK